jgi:integrase
MCCWLFVHDRKITGLDSWLSGVAAFAKSLNLPPLPRNALFKDVRAGLANIVGQVDTRAPAATITEIDLALLRDTLDLSAPHDLEFWVGCLLGFQGLLRASEFCGGGLAFGHLVFHGKGVQISIPFSKTTLTPATIALVRRDDPLCPWRALRLLASTLQSQGPLSKRTPLVKMSYNAFNSMLKKHCAAINIKNPGISTHTLRRSGATQLFKAGVPGPTIMAHGRWRSMSWLQYVEFDFEQQQLPTALLLRASSARS